MTLTEDVSLTSISRVLEYILRVAGLLHVSMKLRYANVGTGAVCRNKPKDTQALFNYLMIVFAIVIFN